MAKLHFQRGSGELARQDDLPGQRGAASGPIQPGFACRMTNVSQLARDILSLETPGPTSREAHWSQANGNALSLWFRGSGVGRSPTSVPREPQEPLSPLPPRPPPLFTDGAETIRLKTEGKSRAVGHNHPGLGGHPLQPWGCGTAHGAHATSPVVLTGRGRWLQERGEEGKARRPGWQLRSEEGLGARVQPRQGPGQLPARLQLPPVPLWPLVCASASHTCLGDSSHLPPCTGGQRLERSW